MIAFALTLFLMTADDAVPHAHTEGPNQICVDIPEGLVDWEALARTKLGDARIDHPSKAFLRKHLGEYGPSVTLNVAPTAAVTARPWNVLHETGVYRLHPGSLQVTVEYPDERMNLQTSFSGWLCGHTPSPLNAAFVLSQDFKLLGEAKWGVDVIRPGEAPCFSVEDCAAPRDQANYTFLWDGHRYQWKHSWRGSIMRASVFRREDEKVFILIRWVDAGCYLDFSLFEVTQTKLIQVGDTDYGCD